MLEIIDYRVRVYNAMGEMMVSFYLYNTTVSKVHEEAERELSYHLKNVKNTENLYVQLTKVPLWQMKIRKTGRYD